MCVCVHIYVFVSVCACIRVFLHVCLCVDEYVRASVFLCLSARGEERGRERRGSKGMLGEGWMTGGK